MNEVQSTYLVTLYEVVGVVDKFFFFFLAGFPHCAATVDANIVIVYGSALDNRQYNTEYLLITLPALNPQLTN